MEFERNHTSIIAVLAILYFNFGISDPISPLTNHLAQVYLLVGRRERVCSTMSGGLRACTTIKLKTMSMTMRMTPPPTTRQTHRHSRFLVLHPTIIALFLCSAGAYAFTHPITAITSRLSSLLSLSPQHYAPPPPPSSPSTSSLSLLQRHDEQLHRYNRRERVSRLVVALSSSSSSSSESSSTSDNNLIPETFREGEIIGLRYMQDGRHEEALKGER